MFIPLSVTALELSLGLNCSNGSIDMEGEIVVDDPEEDNTIVVANIGDSTTCLPRIGIRSENNYFNARKTWGYFFESSGSVFNFRKQSVSGMGDVNMGTSTKGNTAYTVSVLFYNFKNAIQGWSLKTGLGAGVGYLDIKGDIKITEESSLKYGEVEQLDYKGVTSSAGVYFEASKDSHLFILQMYGPSFSDNGYDYHYKDVSFSYSYLFSLFK